MHRLAALSLLIVAWFSVATCLPQFPCGNRLRHVAAFSVFFEHCKCRYSDWTKWTIPVNAVSVAVPEQQCLTKMAWPEERWRTVISGYECEDIRDERHICEPNVPEKIILALKLSSTVHGTSTGCRGRRQASDTLQLQDSDDHEICRKLSHFCHRTEVCHNFTSNFTFTGRRSISEERIPLHIAERRSTIEPNLLEIHPIPFDLQEHGPRFQHQVMGDRCYSSSNKTRYVLFMLDTSGSISPAEFADMTHQLSRLAFYFCSDIKVAVMTFNHNYSVEFCFDCHENDCEGRRELRDDMRRIQHRSGHTYTAGAARCACNFMLSNDCGFVKQDACIDVVIVTDGRSNDPPSDHSDVCKEITCLQNKTLFPEAQVNVFVFGISDYVNKRELECLTSLSIKPLPEHIFNFISFDDFVVTLNYTIIAINGTNVTCIDPPIVDGRDLDCSAYDDD